MRMRLLIAAAFWLSLIPVRADTPPSAAPAAPGAAICTGESADGCGVSEQDFNRAREAFDRGLSLKNKRPEEALNDLTLAVHLVPRNAQYISTRALVAQQLVFEHIQRGNEFLSRGDKTQAATEFRAALQIDPTSQFAAQRLRDVSNTPLPDRPFYSDPPEEPETFLRPKPGPQTLHLRTDTRGAYTTIGSAFTIKVTFDEPVTRVADVHLDLDQVTFEQAMNAVALVTRTFWAPVSASEVIIAADNPGKRKEYERWLLRTFYLPEISSPQELNDTASLLRTLFDIQKVTQSSSNATLTVRGPARAVLAATQFLQTLRAGRPQVMIDFEVYQITRQMLREVGINLPSQLTVFKMGQTSLNTTTTPIAALLSQAQQQNAMVTLLPNSVPVFGGGKTLMGIQIPPAAAQFSQNDSRITSLNKVTMRGSHGNVTTFRLGTRYPVITSLFASDTPQLGTLPQVTYEDLGVTVKVTPSVHKSDVTLDLEMEMSSLGSQLLNGIPVIDSRRYSGTITVPNDEPALVAGSLSQTEIKSLQGIPGLASLPLVGMLTGTRNTEHNEDELLIVITPHIVAKADPDTSTELVVPRY